MKLKALEDRGRHDDDESDGHQPEAPRGAGGHGELKNESDNAENKGDCPGYHLGLIKLHDNISYAIDRAPARAPRLKARHSAGRRDTKNNSAYALS